MPAKTDSWDQHNVLHQTWPKNCCLCNCDLEIATLKLQLEEAQKVVTAARKLFWSDNFGEHWGDCPVQEDGTNCNCYLKDFHVKRIPGR